MPYTPNLRAPLPLLALAFLGALSALAGGYWDDAWHTERGRDTFFIAPHIAIYAGIATAGAALGGWALLAARRHGIAAVRAHAPMVLAVTSVAVTLASGPIDDAWHRLFGRDSVIWSPPHVLGIAGTLGLGAAILAELARWPQPCARPLTVVAGALVLASAGFTTVEYDTDVPQFDESLYLPALALGAGVGLLLVRSATDMRWAATWSAVVYTVFIALVGAFLSVVDFPPPALPLLLPAAAVVDLARTRRWSPPVAGVAFAAALHLAYVPVRTWLGDGVTFDAADVAVGGVLSAAVAVLVFTLAAWTGTGTGVLGRRSSGVLAAIVAVTVVGIAPPEAGAHDPGQGQDAGSVALRVAADGRDVALTVRLPRATCGATEPVAVVARRAGRTHSGRLIKSGCTLEGAVTVGGRGRWFVYAQMRRDGEALETWLPITVTEGAVSVAEEARYTYAPRQRAGSVVKAVGGVVLYAVMLALVIATFVLVGASQRQRPPAAAASGAIT